MEKRTAGRMCGGCTACCKPFVIPELGKYNASWCRHCAVGKGCRIYKKKPPPCTLYACAWLRGKGGEDFRPDRLKVLIDEEKVRIDKKLVTVTHFYEMEHNALQQPVVSSAIEEAFSEHNVVVLHHIVSDTVYDVQLRVPGDSFTTAEARAIVTAIVGNSV